jgi:two-component system NtrC family sensor kinase
MSLKFSTHFFKGLLIVTGAWLALIGIHDYMLLPAAGGMKEHYILVFVLLLLSWFSFLRIAHAARQALLESNQRLDELNRNLDHKVQERTRDLQNVQNQLLQAEKFAAIGQLAAGIAHEINNPIGFINCNLQTLEKYVAHYRQLLGFLNKLEKALNDKDQERVAEIITSWEKVRRETNFKFIEGDVGNLLRESEEGVETIRKIIADLRAFASPDKGVKDSVDLEALMESMLNIVYNEIKYKAQLRKDYGKVPPIICNPQKIGQVFVNLLTNAAHAIEDKGFITIRTFIKEQYVCVEVSDTGCGIPAEHINRIFDPFFTTNPAGQGLGLSVSYDIIRRHGGALRFSPNPDKGTTFSVMLPIENVYDSSQL